MRKVKTKSEVIEQELQRKKAKQTKWRINQKNFPAYLSKRTREERVAAAFAAVGNPFKGSLWGTIKFPCPILKYMPSLPDSAAVTPTQKYDKGSTFTTRQYSPTSSNPLRTEQVEVPEVRYELVNSVKDGGIYAIEPYDLKVFMVLLKNCSLLDGKVIAHCNSLRQLEIDMGYSGKAYKGRLAKIEQALEALKRVKHKVKGRFYDRLKDGRRDYSRSFTLIDDFELIGGGGNSQAVSVTVNAKFVDFFLSTVQGEVTLCSLAAMRSSAEFSLYLWICGSINTPKKRFPVRLRTLIDQTTLPSDNAKSHKAIVSACKRIIIRVERKINEGQQKLRANLVSQASKLKNVRKYKIDMYRSSTRGAAYNDLLSQTNVDIRFEILKAQA